MRRTRQELSHIILSAGGQEVLKCAIAGKRRATDLRAGV
jgi:hypothetical protein